jgi:DNA polymerase-3 subunit beta
MKIRIGRDDLASAVTATAKALPTRTQLPILAGVMLRADGDHLTVSGFDFEVSNETTVPAHVSEPGAVLVSGRLIADIAKVLPNKPVDISTVGAQVEIVCGSGRFTLPTMAVEDYPALPPMPGSAGSVDAGVFAWAVARTAVAAGRDDNLPILAGVRLELSGDTLTMLATDRFRLAVCDIPWTPDDPACGMSALIPARTLEGMAKTIGGAGTVGVALSRGTIGEGMIGFAAGARRTTSRLIDGEFPPVRRLIPDSFAATATVVVGELAEVVKRVALVAERSTPIRLSFSDDGLVVEASGSEDARASEAMDCTYNGESMTIAFNHQYLLDGLASVGTSMATLSFNEPKNPATLTPADGDGAPMGGYVYLMMPVRLDAKK